MRPFRKAVRIVALAAAMSAPVAAHATAYWGQGNAAATTGDCDSAIQTRQDAMSRATADSYTALASSAYTAMPSGGFTTSSCLDNLLNNGLNVLFSPPNLDSILSSISNGVCSYATSLIQSAASTLSQSVSSSLPVGDIVPGVNLGSLSGGFQISPDIGDNTTGSLINVSGSVPVVGNLAGYWGGTPTQPAAYGDLFGSSGATSIDLFGNQ